MLRHDKTNDERDSGELPGAQGLLRDAFQLIWMREFLHPTPFSDELNGDSRKYEGKKKIGDSECHVIHVVYSGGQGEARWYFGTKDNLPHRVDRLFGGGARVLELTKLDTSPEFKEGHFKVGGQAAR